MTPKFSSLTPCPSKCRRKSQSLCLLSCMTYIFPITLSLIFPYFFSSGIDTHPNDAQCSTDPKMRRNHGYRQLHRYLMSFDLFRLMICLSQLRLMCQWHLACIPCGAGLSQVLSVRSQACQGPSGGYSQAWGLRLPDYLEETSLIYDRGSEVCHVTQDSSLP